MKTLTALLLVVLLVNVPTTVVVIITMLVTGCWLVLSLAATDKRARARARDIELRIGWGEAFLLATLGL